MDNLSIVCCVCHSCLGGFYFFGKLSVYGSFSMRAGLKTSQNDSFFWWKGINSPRLLVIHSNSFSNVWTLLTLTVEQVGSFVIPLLGFHACHF